MPVVSVSQLNNYIRRYIEQNKQLSDIWIKGEISNFKRHYSGHMYITLKDESSTLKAVMFKQNTYNLKFEPSDGMKVIAFGRVSVYEQSGTYQLYVDTMIPDGKGELYAAYEQLKDNLEKEGLFSPELKKPIPLFPEKIGVVTSATGAAIRDILNVLKRRYPIAEVTVYPVKVQGIGASDSICKALDFFSCTCACDVIILGRGGGSIEDLWAFNEEKTVRAIFECNVPIITGIGHETDYTISDFVSDKRAPTPSAAAEICVPSIDELLNYISKKRSELYKCLDSIVAQYTTILEKSNFKRTYNALINVFDKYRIRTGSSLKSCIELIKNKFDKSESKTVQLITALDNLNPLAVLKRGYTIPLLPDGSQIDFSNISHGQDFVLKFDGGSAECVIRRINYDK